MEKAKKRGGQEYIKILRSNLMMLIYILLAVIVLFTILNKNYFSYQNLINILYSASTIGLLAIGQTYLIISGNIDLSCGNVACLFGVVASLLLQRLVPWPVAILMSVSMGVAMGWINAKLVNFFGIQPFIATLAVGSVLEGVTYIICGGRSVPVSDRSFISLGTARFFGIPVPVIIMLILFIVFGFILARTVFGRSVYMIGGNVEASRLAGIEPKKLTTKLYMLNSGIAALAGIIVAARMHSGQPGAVSGNEFDAITAAVLGGVAFTGGKGNLLGCLAGLMTIQCFNTGLTVVGLSSFWQVSAKGILLLAALILDFFRRKTEKI